MLNKKRWGAVSLTINENIDTKAEEPKLKEKIEK
jgi:hypothetical protein